MALSADGKLIAVAGAKKALALIDASSGKTIRSFAGLEGQHCNGAAFAEDGRTLVVWTESQDVSVIDVATGEVRKKYPFAGDEDKRLERPHHPSARTVHPRGAASLQRTPGTHPGPALFFRWERAVRFLGTQLQPVPVPNEKHVAKLIAELNSDDFQVRQMATKELERLGDQVSGACRKALIDRPSLELRRRLEKLLDRQASEAHKPSAERVRLTRSLEALELAGTVVAREVLTALAKGAPGAWLTEQAKAGQERLERRKVTR